MPKRHEAMPGVSYHSAMPVVVAEGLSKTYRVPVRESGLKASVRSLFRREHRTIEAVTDVSFRIESGEIVGFLGPNGAGKTTTLKMLSGLLVPSGGIARVLGFEPFRRDNEYLRRVSLVMGNRSQLNWDLPALDSYELHRAVYRIPRADFVKVRDELIELLDLHAIVDKPVRQLSLGERMKAEIADALLHQPEVMFLDEPTLGLDVTMQRRLRSFLADYNARTGAAILLTSHYMADVEALCPRVLVIHHGNLLFDGALRDLARRFGTTKTIRVQLGETTDSDAHRALLNAVVAHATGQGHTSDDADAATNGEITVRVDREHAPRVAAMLLERLDVVDVAIEEPPIEDAIDRVFTDG
jgi:ABC-2 type transport system ATP-binding protein